MRYSGAEIGDPGAAAAAVPVVDFQPPAEPLAQLVGDREPQSEAIAVVSAPAAAFQPVGILDGDAGPVVEHDFVVVVAAVRPLEVRAPIAIEPAADGEAHGVTGVERAVGVLRAGGVGDIRAVIVVDPRDAAGGADIPVVIGGGALGEGQGDSGDDSGADSPLTVSGSSPPDSSSQAMNTV